VRSIVACATSLHDPHKSRFYAGCYQPIDHTLPAERIAEVLQQSGARVLLVSPALASIQDSLPAVEVLVAQPAWRQFSHLSPSNPALRSGVDSAMYLMFTSGARSLAAGDAAVSHDLKFQCHNVRD
jgi:non-ribosomal peptide synthetase component F